MTGTSGVALTDVVAVDTSTGTVVSERSNSMTIATAATAVAVMTAAMAILVCHGVDRRRQVVKLRVAILVVDVLVEFIPIQRLEQVVKPLSGPLPQHAANSTSVMGRWRKRLLTPANCEQISETVYAAWTGE
jgi:hypothetical protein